MRCLRPWQELLAGTSGGRRGYLTSGGRPDAERLCWLLQRLGADEEATFQQREVGWAGWAVGHECGGVSSSR